jgi:hypothetical protein
LVAAAERFKELEKRRLGLEIDGKGEVACSLVDNGSVWSLQVGDSNVVVSKECEGW